MNDEHLFRVEQNGTVSFLAGTRIVVHVSGLVQLVGDEVMRPLAVFHPSPGFSIVRADALVWAEGPDDGPIVPAEG